jgi:ferritin
MKFKLKSLLVILTIFVAVSANARVPKAVHDRINAQIQHEFEGAQFYLQVSQHFYEKGLDGSGFWFLQQYHEEVNHARMLMDFVKRTRGKVVLTEIAQPPALAGDGLLELMEQSLAVEEENTDRINELYQFTLDNNSHEASTFMQWFVTEQVEEEDLFGGVIDRINLAGNTPQGIFLIDQELGARLPAVIFAPK